MYNKYNMYFYYTYYICHIYVHTHTYEKNPILWASSSFICFLSCTENFCLSMAELNNLAYGILFYYVGCYLYFLSRSFRIAGLINLGLMLVHSNRNEFIFILTHIDTRFSENHLLNVLHVFSVFFFFVKTLINYSNYIYKYTYLCLYYCVFVTIVL